MKLLRFSVEGLSLFKGKVEIDFFAEQKVTTTNCKKMFKVFRNVYKNNVIAITGINASGKTSLLKVISFSLNMLNGRSINEIEIKDILNGSKKVVFEFIFCDDSKLYKMESTVVLSEENDFEKIYIIDKETLHEKKITKIRSKKDLFSNTDMILRTERNNDSQFLKGDMSMLYGVFRNPKLFNFRDLITFTDNNFLSVIGKFPKELIEFLDPSIKGIDYNDETKETIIEFFEREKISLINPSLLERYLSSGTIKGINIFINAMIAFQNGAYLIVDELENHFNREIVATLIRYFMDNKVNKKGATLIYSTHYSELLDEIDRSDNIYLAMNKKGIYIRKLSKILKRNDVKKSEVFKSGFFEHTSPNYKSYLKLKNVIIESLG